MFYSLPFLLYLRLCKNILKALILESRVLFGKELMFLFFVLDSKLSYQGIFVSELEKLSFMLYCYTSVLVVINGFKRMRKMLTVTLKLVGIVQLHFLLPSIGVVQEF